MKTNIQQTKKSILVQIPNLLIQLSPKKKLAIYLLTHAAAVGLCLLHLPATSLFSFLAITLIPIILAAFFYSDRAVWGTTLFFLFLNTSLLIAFPRKADPRDIFTLFGFYTLYLVSGLLIGRLIQLYHELHEELKHKHDTEKLLEEEKNWFNVTLLSIGDGIITTDAAKRIIFMNYQAERITGWSLEKARGMDVSDVYKIFNESSHNPLSDPIGRIMERGVVIGLANHTLLQKKNGREIPISDTGAPIRDKGGFLLGFVLTFRDISAQQALQQKLQTARNQSIQVEKMAGIGQLAAGVAHEINNPLSYISSNQDIMVEYWAQMSGLLEKYRSRYTDEELIKLAKEKKIEYILKDIGPMLDDNITGVKRIAAIVNNLLDFSLADPLALPVEIDFNLMLKNVLFMLQNEIKHVAEVVMNLEGQPVIYGNISELSQVIFNFILNALYGIKKKFRQQGGRLEIATQEKKDQVICRITDNGCGIPEENLPRIFEPFFTTREPGQGTGLGLYIAFNIIVKKYNGEILVHSEVGKGTELTIKLPFHPAQDKQEAQIINST